MNYKDQPESSLSIGLGLNNHNNDTQTHNLITEQYSDGILKLFINIKHL